MRQVEVTEKTIGEHTFYLRPFPAFVAANISGELVKMLSPVVGAIASAIGVSGNSEEAAADVMSMDIDEVAPKLGDALSALSGDDLERLMKKLIINNGNVSVEGPSTDGTVKRLDVDLANEIFCGELQDMLMLCVEVIRQNYSSFFKKLGTQFGSRLVGMPTKVPGTESMDTSI